MFALLMVVWILLFAALILSAADYIGEKSFIKTVLSSVECRVGVGLWVLLAFVLVSPIGFVMVNDFQTGGNTWVGPSIILSCFLGLAAFQWVRDRKDARGKAENQPCQKIHTA